MTQRIILIRHTRLEVAEGICYGQSDLLPCSTFLSEAEEVKKRLSSIEPKKIYFSPLTRCRLLAEYLGTNLYPDSRLMELNFGAFEGRRWSELFESPEGKEWFTSWQTNPCPHGESYLQMQKRVALFLEEKKEEETLILVTHAGVIRVVLTLLGLLSAADSFQFPIDYGAVLEILPDPQTPCGYSVLQHEPDTITPININHLLTNQ